MSYPYGFPPFMPPMWPSVNNGGTQSVEEAIKLYTKILERQEKKRLKKEDEDKKKKEPKPKTFTFLEVLGLLMLAGPVLGTMYVVIIYELFHTIARIIH